MTGSRKHKVTASLFSRVSAGFQFGFVAQCTENSWSRGSYWTVLSALVEPNRSPIGFSNALDKQGQAISKGPDPPFGFTKDRSLRRTREIIAFRQGQLQNG
jgi:hypothetical protein